VDGRRRQSLEPSRKLASIEARTGRQNIVNDGLELRIICNQETPPIDNDHRDTFAIQIIGLLCSLSSIEIRDLGV
jgi:hypothetical protein